MLKPLMIFGAVAVFASACGEAGSSHDPARQANTVAPRGATIGGQGYATILDAPPAPFTPAAPSAAPPKLTPEQLAAHAQFRRASEFQNRVREEVQTLAEKLRRAEKGNFIDLYYENAGEPRV